MTLRAQGNADFREARRSRPVSSRDSRYFISPARPAAIHSGKRASSGNSWTEEMPARSNPASREERLMKSEMRLVSGKVLLSRGFEDARRQGLVVRRKAGSSPPAAVRND